MFKPVSGNLEFEVSLEGAIQNSDGTACTLPIANKKVKISLFAMKEKWLDLEWLGLMAHFEMHIHSLSLLNFFFSTYFVDINKKVTKSPSGKMMVFPRPMVVYKKYRIVPCYPKYAVSCNGEIIKVADGESITVYKRKSNYPLVHIYDPQRGKWRGVGVHRFVALAWVNNDDWMTNFVVNHKDGIKINYKYTNLEWTSYSGNAVHAFATGLREDNKPCKLRDVTTGEIKEFVSISQAYKFLGFKVNHKRKHVLIQGKYEFKFVTDETPWQYEIGSKQNKPGRYIIRTIMSDGEEMTFYDTRDSKSVLKLWNTSTIWEQQEKAYQKYPGIVFEVTDLFDATKPVQAYCVATGKIIEHQTIKGLASLVGINWGVIRDALVKGEQYVKQGFAFRRKTNSSWNTEFIYAPLTPVCIQARHQRTNESLCFPSLRSAAKHFKVDRSLIKLRLKDGSDWNGWTFKENHI